jgi:hypothetical protein
VSTCSRVHMSACPHVHKPVSTCPVSMCPGRSQRACTRVRV